MMPREQRPVGAVLQIERTERDHCPPRPTFSGFAMEGERHVLLARSPDPRLYTDLRCRQAPTAGAPDCRSGRNSTALIRHQPFS